MTLRYRDGRYDHAGAPLTQTALAELRDRWAAAWQQELAEIARETLGIAPVPQQAVEFPAWRVNGFAARFLRRVGEMVVEAYVWAAGGVDAVTERGWRSVAELVARQEQYGQGFVSALLAGELTGPQAVARAQLYGGAAVEAFEQGRADQVGFEPPALPGDGSTACGASCRCQWHIEESPDRFAATWVAIDDDATCQECSERAATWNPWVQPR